MACVVFKKSHFVTARPFKINKFFHSEDAKKLMVNKELTIVKIGTDTLHNVNIFFRRNINHQDNKKLSGT